MFPQRLKIARKNKMYTQEELVELVLTTKALLAIMKMDTVHLLLKCFYF